MDLKFLEEQGILIKETKAYQDNTSSILMENNMKQSSTEQTKHMDICYFYIRNISIQHYPTKDMVTDYFTKPLQGSMFIKLHNYIMGAEYGDGDLHPHKSVLDQVDDKPDLDGNSECEIDANICEPMGQEIDVGKNTYTKQDDDLVAKSPPTIPILTLISDSGNDKTLKTTMMDACKQDIQASPFRTV